MIPKFVEKYEANKAKLEAAFRAKHPESYGAIVKAVIEILHDNEYGTPDPERITEIDHGEYQGTLVYVIGDGGYQPSDYWFVKVGYGSCSGCDTLKGIRQYEDDPPTAEQVKDYMTLALHIVQGLKSMNDPE